MRRIPVHCSESCDMTRPHAARRRQAFTLVEMLVALALILFIMSIISYAFQEATATFRDLKSAGDMAEKLRAAVQTMRRDLAANHFDNQRRLSDTTFWGNPPTQPNQPPMTGFFRIWNGSPTIGASGPNNFDEGQDVDGYHSYRTTDHMLHFAVTFPGYERSDYMSAWVPGTQATSPLLALTYPQPWEPRYQDTANTYNSQYGEVAYFLRQISDTANGTPLYALYRRQWLAVHQNSDVTPAVAYSGGAPTGAFALDTNTPPNNYYLEMSARPDASSNGANLYFNNLNDLAIPVRRYGMNQINTITNYLAGIPQSTDPVRTANGLAYPYNASYPIMSEEAPSLNNFQFKGADVLLTDVISFDVRVLLAGDTDFRELFEPQVQAYSNSNPAFYSAANYPTGPAVFDTWAGVTDLTYPTYSYLGPLWSTPGTQTSIPLFQNANGQTIRIMAIQVTLRIWDPKTQKARQTSFIQNL